MQRSPEINELVAALAKAQHEFEPIYKESDNPYYKSKYADLAAIIKATQPALNANGLTVMQGVSCSVETSTVAIETMMAHTSGQWISETLHLPGVQKERFDAQSVGSSITYGRRYGWQSMTGVCADVDDDANAAVGIGSKEAAKDAGTKQFVKKAKEIVSQEQAKTAKETLVLAEWKEGFLAVAGDGALSLLKNESLDGGRLDPDALKEIGFKRDEQNVLTIPSGNAFKLEDLCNKVDINLHWARSAKKAVGHDG